jgi:hypothetical protein
MCLLAVLTLTLCYTNAACTVVHCTARYCCCSGSDILARHAIITHSVRGMVMLLPMRGASVHINGVSAAAQQQQQQHDATASAHAAGNPHKQQHQHQHQQQQQQQQPILLTHRSRVIFGRHHVLRFEGGSSSSSSNSTGDTPAGGGESHVQQVEVDWAFAQNELLRKNPELAPQVCGTPRVRVLLV